jgi:hypothetical protein
MPQKHTPKSEAGKQSSSTSKATTKPQARREQASKAADAGAAPEQLDAEPE